MPQIHKICFQSGTNISGKQCPFVLSANHLSIQSSFYSVFWFNGTEIHEVHIFKFKDACIQMTMMNENKYTTCSQNFFHLKSNPY